MLVLKSSTYVNNGRKKEVVDMDHEVQGGKKTDIKWIKMNTTF